jgi:hypothetical protein
MIGVEPQALSPQGEEPAGDSQQCSVRIALRRQPHHGLTGPGVRHLQRDAVVVQVPPGRQQMPPDGQCEFGRLDAPARRYVEHVVAAGDRVGIEEQREDGDGSRHLIG